MRNHCLLFYCFLSVVYFLFTSMSYPLIFVPVVHRLHPLPLHVIILIISSPNLDFYLIASTDLLWLTCFLLILFSEYYCLLTLSRSYRMLCYIAHLLQRCLEVFPSFPFLFLSFPFLSSFISISCFCASLLFVHSTVSELDFTLRFQLPTYFKTRSFCSY